jgi:hypothetical protein
MSTDSKVYEELNKAWKATCRVLFGEEVGNLKEFDEWLSKYVGKPRIEKSAISGDEVYLAVDDYCKGARFISNTEIDFSKKFEPLNINEIKDIDSIVEAVSDRIYYSGNIILGNSKFVEGSSNITNSFYAYKSFRSHEDEYVAYRKLGKGSKYLFGGTGGYSSYMIKGIAGLSCQRCFEYWSISDSSDIYYSTNLNGCADCMFCFNVNGKRRAIGNLELPLERYKELKKKLVSEIVDELKQKRRAPSLLELISQFPRETLELKLDAAEPFDLSPVETAFQDTFKLIFKQGPRGSLDSYGKYLTRHIPKQLNLTKTSSKEPVIISALYAKLPIPESRIVSIRQVQAIAKNPPSLDLEEVRKLSLADVSSLSKLAFIALELDAGKNRNIDQSTIVANSVDCYKGDCFSQSKSSAFSFWPRESSCVFGSVMSLNSSFCINSHQSEKLTRSFEVDNCNSCSDIYYSHNCENVHDSMFCFNVKNLNRAVGNFSLSPDSYKKIKDQIIGQLADELAKKKGLKWDIFNIGCFGSRQD